MKRKGENRREIDRKRRRKRERKSERGREREREEREKKKGVIVVTPARLLSRLRGCLGISE